MNSFTYDKMKISLNKTNNGTLEVVVNNVEVSLKSKYECNAWVDWLKNSTGDVTFKVSSNMYFSYNLSLDNQKVKVSTVTNGKQLEIKNTNATIVNDE